MQKFKKSYLLATILICSLALVVGIANAYHPEENTSSCTDSEGGVDYSKKGSVSYEGIEYTDRCGSETQLREYYCSDSGWVDKIKYECPNGCSNGVCLDESESNNIESITLVGEGYKVEWEVSGNSSKGFKVVWSKNSGPTYPTRSGDKYHYYSDPNKNYDKLTAFKGGGTYYVRVCEYLGGACGTYSNEIAVNLEGENKIPTCTDTDGGDSIYTLGKTYGTRADGSYYKIYDSCNSADTQVNEMYCSDGSYENKTVDCPNGCVKGRCLKEAVVCTMDYSPVCGKDGKTYSNKCAAVDQNGVRVAYEGECKKDDDIIKIEEKSSLLLGNKIDAILGELKELRNLVREQQNQIKYLNSLLGDMAQITSAMQSSINNFITYGVDDNTKRLGEGERAAVIHSFKEAFGKLPQDESELTDVIKIANGRWPSKVNSEAETRAKDKFKKIFKKIPDMDNQYDNAAVVIMSYGLRQKAENRNLNSERNALKTFKAIFNHLPESTADWNALQAISYSGSSRELDSDNDYLPDDREYELGTNPYEADSDGDGFEDGEEVSSGYNPLD